MSTTAQKPDDKVADLSLADHPSCCAPGSALTFAAYSGYIQSMTAQAEREADETLRRAAQEMPPELSVTTQLRVGRVGEQIIDATWSEHFDLVIIGSRGRGRLRSALSRCRSVAPIFTASAFRSGDSSNGGDR